MNTLHVTDYLRMRKQGVEHAKAFAHTMQRFGVSAAALGAELSEAATRHEHILSLLKEASNEPD